MVTIFPIPLDIRKWRTRVVTPDLILRVAIHPTDIAAGAIESDEALRFGIHSQPIGFAVLFAFCESEHSPLPCLFRSDRIL